MALKMISVAKEAKLLAAQYCLESLSIEEKERVFKLRGILNQDALDKIKSQTDRQVAELILENSTRILAKGRDDRTFPTSASAPAAIATVTTSGATAAESAATSISIVYTSSTSTSNESNDEEKVVIPGVMSGTASVSIETTPQRSPTERDGSHTAEGFEWDPVSGKVLEVDPLLGTLLYRVGNRRLFMMDVTTLSSIPVWEKQRV
jgi:hypothetical protein